jgi:surface antigen
MNKSILVLACMLVFGASLTACSTFTTNKSSNTMAMSPSQPQSQPTGLPDASTMGSEEIAGKYEQSMDELDKSKLSRALDAGLGKETKWANASTGLSYTVVPIRKVSINGNAFCRQYSITVEKNDKSNTLSGTACVASDGAWHIAG